MTFTWGGEHLRTKLATTVQYDVQKINCNFTRYSKLRMSLIIAMS